MTAGPVQPSTPPPDLPGTEATHHVAGLMDAAHADWNARSAHGRQVADAGPHDSPYPDYPAPMGEAPPPGWFGDEYPLGTEQVSSDANYEC